MWAGAIGVDPTADRVAGRCVDEREIRSTCAERRTPRERAAGAHACEREAGDPEEAGVCRAEPAERFTDPVAEEGRAQAEHGEQRQGDPGHCKLSRREMVTNHRNHLVLGIFEPSLEGFRPNEAEQARRGRVTGVTVIETPSAPRGLCSPQYPNIFGREALHGLARRSSWSAFPTASETPRVASAPVRVAHAGTPPSSSGPVDRYGVLPTRHRSRIEPLRSSNAWSGRRRQQTHRRGRCVGARAGWERRGRRRRRRDCRVRRGRAADRPCRRRLLPAPGCRRRADRCSTAFFAVPSRARGQMDEVVIDFGDASTQVFHIGRGVCRGARPRRRPRGGARAARPASVARGLRARPRARSGRCRDDRPSAVPARDSRADSRADRRGEEHLRIACSRRDGSDGPGARAASRRRCRRRCRPHPGSRR